MSTIKEEPRYLTPLEAAKLLRRHRGTVYRWLEAGSLPGRKIAGSWYVDAAELERLLDASDAGEASL
jgi:excisionase family DNA binding protein